DGVVPAALRELVRTATRRSPGKDTAGSDSTALRQRLVGMTAHHQRQTLLDLVRVDVAAVLGYGAPEAIDPAHPFAELGLDSLTALDLRDRLGAATGLQLSAALPFEYSTCVALASHLSEQILMEGPIFRAAGIG